MRKEPGLKEDAKNLTLIGGSACVAALLTAGFLFARSEPSVRVMVVEPAVEVIELEPMTWEYEVVTPLTGANRLYGTVTTRSGEHFTGYIRWDRNEGSLTDLLDAYKSSDRGDQRLSGIRFGHVDRIEVTGRSGADFLLKSGERIRLDSYSTDLGSGLRALIVDGDDGTRAELTWHDLEEVDFMPPPRQRRPAEGRLFGTLTTRSGLEFTGFITWDVDEIYSSDILDGDLDGERLEIPFGAIAAIERFSSRSALVVLHGGEEMVLDGTNDVDSSISGISVSDVNLGQVKLDWSEFDRVVFHGTDNEPSAAFFDGGRRIEGTVITDSGEQLSGLIRWDGDEAYTWEMLNGQIRDVEFDVEFGNIERIERTSRGATVTLRDGRTFDLSDSNDVDRNNGGIFVETDRGTERVSWQDFRELRLAR